MCEFECFKLSSQLSYISLKLGCECVGVLQSHIYHLVCYTDALVQKLLPLGFTRAAIRKELIETNGNLNEAASNLLWQLPDSKAQGVLASIKKEEKKFTISSVEV